jgi:hypothetical protein
MTKTQTAAAAAQCLFRACRGPIAYQVVEHRGPHVADRTVYTCEAHRPGSKARGVGNPPAPSGVAYASQWYTVTPIGGGLR